MQCKNRANGTCCPGLALLSSWWSTHSHFDAWAQTGELEGASSIELFTSFFIFFLSIRSRLECVTSSSTAVRYLRMVPLGFGKTPV